MGKKINDFLNKQRKKFKKQTRMAKREENFKCKPGVPKNLQKWRTKSKQTVEGMFSKGLRSEYISRESLSEANEARKKEDINKIIDLGRVFQQKEECPRRYLKQIAACSSNKSSDCFNKVSRIYKKDTQQCPPSPISLSSTPEENCRCIVDSDMKKDVFGEVDSENEFAMFSSKYEETVGVQVLHKLPKNGVLEKAIRELKKVQKNEQGEEFRESETEFEKEFILLKHDFCEENSAKENFFENFDSPKQCHIPECEKFSGEPLENLFMTTDVEFNNYYHPLFSPSLNNDDDNRSLDTVMFQEKDFEKPAKDLHISTPPFHFYRRNMF